MKGPPRLCPAPGGGRGGLPSPSPLFPPVSSWPVGEGCRTGDQTVPWPEVHGPRANRRQQKRDDSPPPPRRALERPSYPNLWTPLTLCKADTVWKEDPFFLCIPFPLVVSSAVEERKDGRIQLKSNFGAQWIPAVGQLSLGLQFPSSPSRPKSGLAVEDVG